MSLGRCLPSTMTDTSVDFRCLYSKQTHTARYLSSSFMGITRMFNAAALSLMGDETVARSAKITFCKPKYVSFKPQDNLTESKYLYNRTWPNSVKQLVDERRFSHNDADLRMIDDVLERGSVKRVVQRDGNQPVRGARCFSSQQSSQDVYSTCSKKQSLPKSVIAHSTKITLLSAKRQKPQCACNIPGLLRIKIPIICSVPGMSPCTAKDLIPASVRRPAPNSVTRSATRSDGSDIRFPSRDSSV